MYAPHVKAEPTRTGMRSSLAAQGPAPQKVAPELDLARALGNRGYGQFLQAKLTVGAPDDPYEQEADRVANQVMRMPEPVIQRACECGGTCASCREDETLQRQPVAETITPLVQRQVGVEERVEDEELLQAKATSGSVPAAPWSTEARIHSLRGGGHPLPESARRFFEPRFGQDFSAVRIHTDTRAASAARSINARAFTMGRDVVFGTGQYTPGTTEGRQLLAHELTHTIQQKNDIKGQVLQRWDWDDVLDVVQVGLDIGGLVPAAGFVPDLINAGISGLRGDEVGAALSLAAAVPGAGLAVGVGKLGAKGVKALKAAKGGKELAEAAAKKATKEKLAKEATKKAAKEKAAKEAAAKKAAKEKAGKGKSKGKEKKKGTKGKWGCQDVRCNVYPDLTRKPPKTDCPKRVIGATPYIHPSYSVACRAAQVAANLLVPKGCIKRHCNCKTKCTKK